LGAKSMNLLGTSYGTRLAQEIMRQAPESLRSVTLDSTLPPDLDALAQTAVAAERAFRQVFIACAEDLTCREAFPDIEARFYEVVATLNEHPLLVQNGDEQTRIDGERFVQLLGLLQYDINGVVRIPGIIAEAESGQSDTIQQLDLLRAAPDAGIAAGMNLSVVCAEYAPLTSVDKVALAERGVRPEISSVFNAQKYLVACPIWSVPAAPATESMPVRSSVSTLILEGSFDPSTPPSWGDHVASGLSRAHIALIGAATHGVARTECGMTALASFVHDPANYTHPGCVAQSSPQLWTQAAMSGAMK
ncbi:MAG TPA: alpha/beta hydrolase, partial [Polyangiaceae bacterium]|nr:alpha/beta hydrolase [Polyangiaceae bacterium]